MTALRQTIEDARRALSDLGYLFTAEQHRLTREFEEERSRFLDTTLTAAATKFDKALSAAHRVSRAEVFRSAEQIAHDAITAWMEQMEPRAGELYVRATDSLQHHRLWDEDNVIVVREHPVIGPVSQLIGR